VPAKVRGQFFHGPFFLEAGLGMLRDLIAHGYQFFVHEFFGARHHLIPGGVRRHDAFHPGVDLK